MKTILATLLLVLCTALAGVGPASAQCRTFLQSLGNAELEYFGRHADTHRVAVGQHFFTDCDGLFLTAAFWVYLDAGDFGGTRSLTIGDTLVCTISDAQRQPIAAVAQVLDFGFGYRWVTFDFAPLGLGLAAGPLNIVLSTPAPAYGWIATDLDRTAGELLIGYDDAVYERTTREACYRVTWDPYAGVTPAEPTHWGRVKAMYR